MEMDDHVRVIFIYMIDMGEIVQPFVTEAIVIR